MFRSWGDLFQSLYVARFSPPLFDAPGAIQTPTRRTADVPALPGHHSQGPPQRLRHQLPLGESIQHAQHAIQLHPHRSYHINVQVTPRPSSAQRACPPLRTLHRSGRSGYSGLPNAVQLSPGNTISCCRYELIPLRIRCLTAIQRANRVSNRVYQAPQGRSMVHHERV